MRRKELRLLGEKDDDDAVVDSFLGSVTSGLVWDYLCESSLLVLLGPWLFVHGGLAFRVSEAFSNVIILIYIL